MSKVWNIGEWINYQCKLLPHRPRLLWHRLWVRKDEFHNSFNMDCKAMLIMNKIDTEIYIKNLTHRRRIAHERT